jgi:crotonobetainyl-CoA:carnitine CoA-transferase CaiB-like acyl-CoA transferase
VVAAFERDGVAGAPVLDIAGLMADPHVQFRQAFVSVPDDDGRPVVMPNLLFRLDRTPGEVRHPGRSLGADTEAILIDLLGLSRSRVAQLRKRGVVA